MDKCTFADDVAIAKSDQAIELPICPFVHQNERIDIEAHGLCPTKWWCASVVRSLIGGCHQGSR